MSYKSTVTTIIEVTTIINKRNHKTAKSEFIKQNGTITKEIRLN